MKVFLKKVRVAYPNLHTPRGFEGSAEKFSATYLMQPNHPAVKDIMAAMSKVAQEKWGAKGEATLKALRGEGRVCLKDGDAKDKEEFEGHLYINASSSKRVKVVDSDGVTALEEMDGKPYSGCYVNAYVEIWAMDNKFGKRICAGLGGVQFHSDGEPFAGGGGNDTFAAVEDDESLV